ncbi:MAG TPA: TIGR02266 family protein [Thermoanaerobaculia bacterium]|nr:TIGR02266 family protein [Thermoanaerobaculia bacterium]
METMVDYTNIPRDSRRVPLETRVQFKFDRFSGFISEYSSNISPGGMFIRTKTPLPSGQTLDFAFRLGDGFELIKGKGEIVWARMEDEGPARPAGMGLRFLELSEGSQELIYRIVDQHILEGGTPFDVSLIPPDPVAPRPAPAPVLPFAAPEPAAPPLPAAAALPDPFPELSTPDPRVESSPDASAWLPSIDVPDPVLDPEPLPALPEFQAFLESSSPAPSDPDPAPSPLAAPTFGSAAAKQPRNLLPFFLLAAGLLLVAGLFLFKDRLLDLAGMGWEDEIAQAPPPPVRRAPEPPAPAPAGPASTVPAPELVEEGQPPAAGAAKPMGAPASFVGKITWEEAFGGTDVILWGDGAIRSDRFTRSRIEGNPPRELIRLTGIDRAYPGTRVVVGTGDLLQIRVGYHPKAGGNELHVVLDLAHPTVAVTRVEEGEDRLRIHLQRQ